MRELATNTLIETMIAFSGLILFLGFTTIYLLLEIQDVYGSKNTLALETQSVFEVKPRPA